jgi:hypothetical protein
LFLLLGLLVVLVAPSQVVRVLLLHSQQLDCCYLVEQAVEAVQLEPEVISRHQRLRLPF